MNAPFCLAVRLRLGRCQCHYGLLLPRRPDNQPDGFGATYRGIGNSLCTNTEGAGECWEQTQDGRYWHMEIYGSVSRACFESGLVEWLQGVEKAQGHK